MNKRWTRLSAIGLLCAASGCALDAQTPPEESEIEQGTAADADGEVPLEGAGLSEFDDAGEFASFDASYTEILEDSQSLDIKDKLDAIDFSDPWWMDKTDLFTPEQALEFQEELENGATLEELKSVWAEFLKCIGEGAVCMGAVAATVGVCTNTVSVAGCRGGAVASFGMCSLAAAACVDFYTTAKEGTRKAQAERTAAHIKKMQNHTSKLSWSSSPGVKASPGVKKDHDKAKAHHAKVQRTLSNVIRKAHSNKWHQGYDKACNKSGSKICRR